MDAAKMYLALTYHEMFICLAGESHFFGSKFIEMNFQLDGCWA